MLLFLYFLAGLCWSKPTLYLPSYSNDALYSNTTSVSMKRVIRAAADTCPVIPIKEFTDVELKKGLEGMKTEFETSIVLALKGASTVVREIKSISAAPEAVLIAENLCSIAALTPEVSLVSDLMPLEKFQYLTTPRSFRGSMIQMVDSMCNSFLTADGSMNRIMLALVSLPSILSGTVKMLSSNDTESRNFLLEMNLETIRSSADICATEAAKVANKFDGTLALLSELHLGCTTCESNSNMKKAEKEAAKLAIEGEAAVEKEYKAQIEKDEQEMRKNVKNTLDRYNKEVKKMGNLGVIFVTTILDFVKDVAGIFVSGITGGRGGGGKSPMDDPSNSAVKQQAKTFWNRIVTRVPAGEKTSKADLIAFFKTAIDSDIGKAAPEIVGKAQAFLAKLNQMNEAEDDWQQRVSDELNALKASVQQLAGESVPAVGGSSGSGSSTRNSIAKGVEALSQQYQYQTRLAEELREKMRESSLRLNNLTFKLKNLNLETVKLAQIIESLNEGLKLLNEAKVVWMSLQTFFSRFRDMAADVLSKNLQRFETIANRASVKQTKMLEQALLETSTKLIAEGTAMHFCAETYAELSRKWLMPIISGVGKNLQLTREEAKIKLDASQKRVDAQLCDVNNYLTNRVNQAMEVSKKQSIDFLKTVGQVNSNGNSLLN